MDATIRALFLKQMSIVAPMAQEAAARPTSPGSLRAGALMLIAILKMIPQACLLAQVEQFIGLFSALKEIQIFSGSCDSLYAPRTSLEK